MSDRPFYVLPFRAVVLGIVGVVLVGALGGALGAWVTVRRLLRVTPGGERVVERVERVTVAGEEALGSAAAAVALNTYAVLLDSGRVVQQAVALTDDGVLASVGPIPRGAIRVQRVPGQPVPASIVRIYPEAGVWFLKAQGTFTVADLERERLPSAGARLAAVAAPSETAGIRVKQVSVEVIRTSGDRAHADYVGLDRLPVLDEALPPSFLGAPLVGAEGAVYGLALLANDGTSVLPSTLLNVLLNDYLQHPSGTDVRVLAGLRGRWANAVEGADGRLTFSLLSLAPGSALGGGAGLRERDELRALNGKPLEGSAQLFRVFLEAGRANQSVSATVRRGPQEATLELRPSIP